MNWCTLVGVAIQRLWFQCNSYIFNHTFQDSVITYNDIQMRAKEIHRLFNMPLFMGSRCIEKCLVGVHCPGLRVS